MKQMKKVLFPTKFESQSYPCVERLLPLKAAGLEEIIFLFVINREEVAGDLFRGFDKELVAQLKEEARLRFEDWSKDLEKEGVRSSYVIEIGRPEGKILEIACREEVDLITSGRQRHMPVDSVYLGGTAMGVLRRTAIPVFVCKHIEGACGTPGVNDFERVLLATDFSDDASCALEFVKALKGVARNVDVVHVISERDFKKHTEEELRQEEISAQQQMDAICAELRALGMTVQSHLLAGPTATEVLQSSLDHHATLVVMGTKGRHGLKEIWLGSASHRVAELSTVPVVLVPSERAECYI